mmetsp:Transcript_40254/g.64687  ORF Transcript_40254/g.64687 Transcript_40254/m.64687 type:complete len:149 (-) Transcript_40254:142-588(-)
MFLLTLFIRGGGLFVIIFPLNTPVYCVSCVLLYCYRLGSNFARKLGYEMIDAVDQGNDDDQKMVWNADDSSDEEDDEGDTDNIISQRPNNKKMTTTARNLKQESKTSSSSSSWASYAKNDTSDTVGDLDLLAASVGSMSLNDDDECEL